MTTWETIAKTEKRANYPSLKENILADVVIIGGGITGLLNAYYLTKSGKKVVLIEKDELGSFATLYTTAFITKVIDSDLSEMIDLVGGDAAKTVWESGQTAINEFADIIEENHIECEFMKCPNFIYAQTEKQFKTLKKEREAYERLKIPAELKEDGSDLGFANFGYLKVPDQAKFDVAKFIFTLAEIVSDAGGLIYEHSEAVDIVGNGPVLVNVRPNSNGNSSGGKSAKDMIQHGSVTAKDVIIATYKPITNQKTHLKKGMYRSYIYEIEVGRSQFPEAIYQDKSNPYYYFRVDRYEKHDRIIIGGEDHRDIFGESLKNKSLKSLEEFFKKIYPSRNYKVITKWSGKVLEPSDGLALIGQIKPAYYVATAFSGNGMTYSMISALIIRDLILGRMNKWAEVYDPKRSILKPKRLGIKAKDYIEEFFGGALKNMLK